MPWAQLGPEFFKVWGRPRGKTQPEHLEILGQTGSGKSYFEATILSGRARARNSHVVVIATKPADATLTALGWPVIESWPPDYNQNQVIFWAKARGLGQEALVDQKRKIETLLGQLWTKDSNRIIAFDEIAYVEQTLGLRTLVTQYYREARALGITIVASTQRPQGVSRYVHSESGWSVFFAPKDASDAERMAEVAGDKKFYLPVLNSLNREKYEFLMVRELTGEKYISHITGKLPRVHKRS